MNSVKDTTTTNNQTMNVFIPFLKATTQVLEELTQEIFTKKYLSFSRKYYYWRY
jgi:hypothetical protein